MGSHGWDLNITWCSSGYTSIEYNTNGLGTIIDIWINEGFSFGFQVLDGILIVLNKW